MIGASTRWRVRHLDGPINPSRSGGNTERRRMLAGTGPVPGAWAWGGQGQRPLPYTPTKRSIPLFSAGGRMEYAEVDTSAGIDADVLVALDMNETVRLQHPSWTDWMMQFDRSPNTGALGGVAMLLGGATFTAPGNEGPATPVYYNRGIVGECVTIKGDGHVEFTHQGINAGRPQATVAGWVWLSPDTHGWRPLVRKLGTFAIEGRWVDSSATAEIRVSCTLNNLSVPPAVATLGIAPNTWTHLALVFDGTTNPARISLALNGTECAVISVPGVAQQLAGSSSPLQLGPVGAALAATAEMRVDQFRFDRAARTAAEIAQLAYVPAPPSTTRGVDLWFTNRLAVASRSAAGATVPVFPGGSPLNQPLTRGAIDLGADLFADHNLAPDGAMACSSCHVPSKLFTDGNVRGVDRNGQQQLRNVPSVLDRVWGRSHFLDGRRDNLESLVLDPLFHPTELASSEDYLLGYLATSPYAGRFSTVYGSVPSLALLQHALASYMRALVSNQSTADKFEDGSTTLVGGARRGRDLFFGRARCATCHTGPNWSDEQFHVTPIATTDRGRFAVTGRLHDDFRFRTPSLRNVSLTAPYFHDGSAATLHDVVEIYRAGAASPAHRDEEIFPLDLSDGDVGDLVTFLHTLASGWTKL